MNATTYDNMHLRGNLKVDGELKLDGLDADDYTVTSANAVAAAGSAPTKAEFDAVVTLVNELKADHNALVEELTEE